MEDRFRVRVDAGAGAVEVEGPESFVREMLDRYSAVLGRPPEVRASVRRARGKRPKSTGAKEAPAPAPAAKARAVRVEVDEALQHELQQRAGDLHAYIEERKIASQTEEAAIVAAFLGTLGYGSMNEAQYVTALRVLGRRLPKNPRQVLIDAKNKKQYFFEDGSSFVLSHTGTNFVEIDSLKSKDAEGES
jgi:hypothetical protein